MFKFISRPMFGAILALGPLLAGLAASPAAAATLSYSGRWLAEEDETGRLLQGHYQSLGLTASQEFTEQLTVDESLRYFYNWREREFENEIVAPGLELRLHNDLFAARLGALANHSLKSESPSATTSAVDSSWSSNWRQDFVPTFRAFYQYLERSDDLNVHLVDETTHTYGGKADWDLRWFQAYYSYDYSRREELGRQLSETEQDSQKAGVRFNRGLWDNRLQLRFSQEYTTTSGQREVVIDSTSFALIPQSLADVRIGTDPTPADTDETPLVSNNAMRDGDLLTAVYPVAANTTDNSLLLVVNGQPVDRLYLYTQTNVLGALGLSWRLYSNDILGTAWNLETLTGVSYDPVNRRFVLQVNPTLSANYLKVVLDLGPLAPPISFTEVEVLHVVAGPAGTVVSSRSEGEAERTTAGLDFKINQLLLLYYSLSRSTESQDGEDYSKGDTHNVGLRYANRTRDLRSTLSYAIDQRWHQPGTESESVTYLFYLSKQLLPTLGLSTDLTRSEFSLEGQRLSSTDSFKLYCDAQLYPDLSARVEGNYTKNDSEDGAVPRTREVILSNLAVTSRLKPTITMSLGYGYQEDLDQGETTEIANRFNVNLVWQPADLLIINGGASHLTKQFGLDVSSLSTTLTVGLTETMELRGQYSLVDSNDIISQTGQIKWRWNVRKFLTWESWVDYAEADNVTQINTTKFFCQLSANFSSK